MHRKPPYPIPDKAVGTTCESVTHAHQARYIDGGYYLVTANEGHLQSSVKRDYES